jgi:hypothetical protein
VAIQRSSVAAAYSKLRNILQESKVRETVKFQERFERRHDKKKRKRNAAEWRQYMAFLKKQVQMAKDLEFKYVSLRFSPC